MAKSVTKKKAAPKEQEMTFYSKRINQPIQIRGKEYIFQGGKLTVPQSVGDVIKIDNLYEREMILHEDDVIVVNGKIVGRKDHEHLLMVKSPGPKNGTIFKHTKRETLEFPLRGKNINFSGSYAILSPEDSDVLKQSMQFRSGEIIEITVSDANEHNIQS